MNLHLELYRLKHRQHDPTFPRIALDGVCTHRRPSDRNTLPR
jgi:hypothetical protein